MSESRKTLNIEGGQVKEDDHIASYKPIPESDTACDVQYVDAQIEFMQMDRPEGVETEIPDDNDDQWDAKSIRMMLDLYLQNVDKFRNPKVRKKNVWIDISAPLGKSPDSCDKKFRNLKQTYIRLLKKKMASGAGKIRWPYFDIFDEIYCVNGEYQPEIQMKIQENTNESVVAKALLSINSAANIVGEIQENGRSSIAPSEEEKKTRRKRFAEMRKVTLEMRDRQRTVEEKLDRLINIIEESNSIQRERNSLFEQFLEKLNRAN